MSTDPRFLERSPFSRLMVTHAVSVCADACVAASLAGSLFFAQPTNAARGDILLYLLLTMAPFAVLAPVMGPALDRIRGGRRIMVVGTCLARALLCFGMAQFIIEPSPEGLLIYPLAFGVLVAQKTYSVARAALVPALVEHEDELVRANSRLAIISLIASMVGGGPALLLQAVFDARWSLALAMIVFVVATVVATKIPRTRVVQDPAAERLEAQEMQQPSILLAGSAMAVIRAAVGVIVFLSAFSFKGDKFELGVVLGAYAVGGFAGNLIAPYARRHVREEVILVVCLLMSASFVLFGALTGGGVAGASLAAISVAIASSAGRVGFDSLLQRDGPDAAHGRAFARFETRFQLAWVLGALFGVLSLGEDVGLFVLGIVLLAAGLSYLAALRSARTRPQRTKLRPEAVDRAFGKAKGELRDRYRRNRDARRSTRGTSRGAPGGPPRGTRGPPGPRTAKPGSGSESVEPGEPPQAFPGGS